MQAMDINQIRMIEEELQRESKILRNLQERIRDTVRKLSEADGVEAFQRNLYVRAESMDREIVGYTQLSHALSTARINYEYTERHIENYVMEVEVVSGRNEKILFASIPDRIHQLLR